MTVIRFVDSVFLENHLNGGKERAGKPVVSEEGSLEEAVSLSVPDSPVGTLGAWLPKQRFDGVEGSPQGLAALLVRHPAATFLMRASGSHLAPEGIHDGDLLVVDRAITPTSGRFVIAPLNGELRVARLAQEGPRWRLMLGNCEKSQLLEEEQSLWGVVTTVIHPV